MAEYQIGSQTYELPDNLPPQQLNQILSQLASQQANNEPDTSFSSAFQSGIDAPLENMATTARMLGAEGTADTLSGLTDAPTNYESASDRFMNPEEGDFTIAGFAPAYLPRASVEQAGQFAGSVATRVGGGAAGLAVSGGNPIVGAAGALAGPALFEFVQQLGPVAAQRAKNNGRTEPNWEDWTAAAGTAGLSGALNSIGVKGFSGAGLLNRTLKEGVTETAQSVVEQTGSTAGTDAGLQVNPKQAIGEGIIGGTSAGGVGVATDTVSGAANLTGRGLRAAKDAVIPSDTPSDAEAAADFAADLERVAAQDGYNLKDVDTGSEIGARAAIDTLHSEYGSQIEVMVKDLADRLKETADDTQLQALEKAKANAAKRKAKNKVKSRVDPTDFQVIEKLTAGTQEGAQLIALMRKSNELSALANKSVKGGISQFTDVFNPLDSDGRYNIGRAIAAPVSGLSAIASGGASLAPAIAGRAIDAVTGRRSRVANYVKQNQGNQGIQIPNLPSERTRKQQEKDAKDQANAKLQADREQANRELGRQGAAPTPGSPQDTVETATGLTKNGVAQIVSIIDRISPNEAIKKAIAEYRTSIDTGGTISNDMLSPLIRQINVMLDGDERLGSKRVREPVRNQDGSPVIASTKSPNYQRGIQSNLKIAQDQIDKVDADNNMSDFDKMVAKDALRELSSNLGSDPVASAEGILKKARVKARKKPKIDEHVKPYVDLVKRQQKQAKKSERVEVNQDVNFQPDDQIPFDDTMIEHEANAEKLKTLIQSLFFDKGFIVPKGKFDKKKVNKLIGAAIPSIDPEGRQLISQIQIGLNGEDGIGAEDATKLAGLMLDALRIVNEPDSTFLGQYRETLDKDENVTWREVRVQDIGTEMRDSAKDIVMPWDFANTILHELGHAVEARSKLRQIMKAMTFTREADAFDNTVMEQAVLASKYRRQRVWKDLKENFRRLQNFTGKQLPAPEQAFDLAYGDPYRLLNDLNLQLDMLGRNEDMPQLERGFNDVVQQVRYAFDPAELSADAVAYYMAEPATFKKRFPELAKVIRKAVNDSDVQAYITFHSVAAMLGLTGMIAMLQNAMSGEDDEERPGILNLLQPQGILQQASI